MTNMLNPDSTAELLWPDNKLIAAAFTKMARGVAEPDPSVRASMYAGAADLLIAARRKENPPAASNEIPDGDAIYNPSHYGWVQDRLGLESWDVLDEFFPHDPHLWNAGKYLIRAGRKPGADWSADLRKAIQYLHRAGMCAQ